MLLASYLLPASYVLPDLLLGLASALDGFHSIS